ncbi:phospho-sugar glycosidase domain-containing protein [Cetobacterium somerae]
MLELECEVYDGVGSVEKDIIEKELHYQRGDVGEYVVRSTQSRVKYKGTHFELFNPVDIKKGDVLIESSLYGQYAGELHIARKDMKNSGKTSVVGKIDPNYMGLLDSIKPWQKFKIKIKK